MAPEEERPQLVKGSEDPFMEDLAAALFKAFGDSWTGELTNATGLSLTQWTIKNWDTFIWSNRSTWEVQDKIAKKYEELLDNYSEGSLGAIHERVRPLYACFLEMAMLEWTQEEDISTEAVEKLSDALQAAQSSRGSRKDPLTMRPVKQKAPFDWRDWGIELKLIHRGPPAPQLYHV